VKGSEWNVEDRIKKLDDRLKDFETSNADRFNVLTSQAEAMESTVRAFEEKFVELHKKAG
jgi:flagellar capping protein FliD